VRHDLLSGRRSSRRQPTRRVGRAESRPATRRTPKTRLGPRRARRARRLALAAVGGRSRQTALPRCCAKADGGSRDGRTRTGPSPRKRSALPLTLRRVRTRGRSAFRPLPLAERGRSRRRRCPPSFFDDLHPRTDAQVPRPVQPVAGRSGRPRGSAGLRRGGGSAFTERRSGLVGHTLHTRSS
jgi:hypothetical protein